MGRSYSPVLFVRLRRYLLKGRRWLCYTFRQCLARLGRLRVASDEVSKLMAESTRLTTEEVRHIALLARVGMTDDEVELMRDQLSDILAQFEALSRVDTGDLEPTGHSVDLLSVMRDDVARPSLSREETLANAPNREGDLVRVKAVLE